MLGDKNVLHSCHSYSWAATNSDEDDFVILLDDDGPPVRATAITKHKSFLKNNRYRCMLDYCICYFVDLIEKEEGLYFLSWDLCR
mmetsp:Transcript_13408/g.33760  ORF Transcript_13408/g.33760 Transcript_13408/m.33760 type:complete len:85 (+) Transcript_13408:1260-1514(+)